MFLSPHIQGSCDILQNQEKFSNGKRSDLSRVKYDKVKLTVHYERNSFALYGSRNLVAFPKYSLEYRMWQT